MEQILENLFNGDHSLTAVMAGLVITLALHLILRVRDIDSKRVEKLTEALDKNTNAISSLSGDMKHFKEKLLENEVFIKKQKTDQRRLFATVKELAGDRWRDIQKKIIEDEILETGKS